MLALAAVVTYKEVGATRACRRASSVIRFRVTGWATTETRRLHPVYPCRSAISRMMRSVGPSVSMTWYL